MPISLWDAAVKIGWDFFLKSTKSFFSSVTSQCALAGKDHSRCLGRVNSSLALLLSGGGLVDCW